MLSLLFRLVKHLLRPSEPELDDAPALRPPSPPQAAREVIRDMIVPMVKVSGEADPRARLVELKDEELPVSRELAGELVTMYVVDFPDHFRFVNRHLLKTEGIAEEELHALAVRNLQNRTQDIQVHGSYPRFMVTAGGNMEATLLHHEDFWRQVVAQIPLQGELLAVVPARDLLAFTDSATEGAREFLDGMVNQDLEDATHILSKQVLARRDGAWVLA